MTEEPMTRRARREAERAAQRRSGWVGAGSRRGSHKGSRNHGKSEQAHHSHAAASTHHLATSRHGEPTEELFYSVTPPKRSRLSLAGRLGILGVLACVTVAAPLTSGLSPFAPAANAGIQATAQPSIKADLNSVAAAVLGSDADLDESSDVEISNVPDAATLARIREAYESAPTTCAPASAGASGDAAAFTKQPAIVYPMVEGTYTISSPFGYRIHPTLGYLKLHAGQDYAAPVGTPIYAAAAGTVVTAGMEDGTGTIVIEHTIDGKTWYTGYLHMYESGIYVKVGDQVTAGQLIAGVGSTGRSTGAHLHFEVRTANNFDDSSAVDPAAWLKEHGAVELSTNCS